jgi:A/G-specific adenine glycosylase
MKDFSSRLIAWFETHQRNLPWRHTQDPYKIWLSEVILQQTRVKQGLPYYEKFLQTFPHVQALAAASEEEVLRCWQGLGYYSRARNLHRAAQQVAEVGGVFPKNYKTLKKLRGVGTYTAAAIASFAYGEAGVAVVDGNVYRVLARIFGLDAPIDSTQGQKKFSQLAHQLLPEGNSSAHNQAIMEFGALHCTPKAPKCADCPLAVECVARAQKKQSELPVKARKTKVRNRYLHYLHISFQDKSLWIQRNEKGIWQGLYTFPMIESSTYLSVKELCKELSEVKIIKHIKEKQMLKHILSHQVLLAKFYQITLEDEKKFITLGERLKAKAYTEQEVYALPKPVLMQKYAEASQASLF